MISTYSELQTAVASWLHRTDLSAVIPDFIALAEERINRALRVRQMEVALSNTAISSNVIAVPADIVGIKSLWIATTPPKPLQPQSLEAVKASTYEGEAVSYAWQGSSLVFDGTGTVAGVLYTKVPALSNSATTNWLLTASPSLYLSGALLEASIYLRDESAIAFHEGRFGQALSEISGNDMRDRFASPLVARAR